MVMAHLYIKGKSCGIQPFMVQLRDEETHLPLPGIKLGEIGAKLGFNTVNNGFLGFEHHRIKRDRMLMKNSKVLKVGFVQNTIFLNLFMGWEKASENRRMWCFSSILKPFLGISKERNMFAI